MYLGNALSNSSSRKREVDCVSQIVGSSMRLTKCLMVRKRGGRKGEKGEGKGGVLTERVEGFVLKVNGGEGEWANKEKKALGR